MLGTSSTFDQLPLVTVLAAWLLSPFVIVPKTIAQASDLGPREADAIAHIDGGVAYDGAQPYVSGWACQLGEKSSIVVRIYADHRADDTPKGTFVAAGQADLDNEQGVGRACQDLR
ncbi:MAG: hypothetical protein WBX22_17705 [Silvibacterium sp.]